MSQRGRSSRPTAGVRAAWAYPSGNNPAPPEDRDDDAVVTVQPPTVDMEDHEVEQLAVDYPVFDDSTSFIVSGPVLVDGVPQSTRGRAMTRADARAWMERTYPGRVLCEIDHPTRWCGRIRKEG